MKQLTTSFLAVIFLFLPVFSPIHPAHGKEKSSPLLQKLKKIEAGLKEAEKLIETMDDLLPEKQPSSAGEQFSPDQFTIELNSLENILEPDRRGWAANMLRAPSISRVHGQLRLFFGTRVDNPGPQGVGYVNLKESGHTKSNVKHKLAVKSGYYSVRTPELLSASNAEDNSQLLTTNYYIRRAGEWAAYLTTYILRSTPQGLRINKPRKILTGSDRTGHWMARSVSDPEVVTQGKKQKLFFKSTKWPKNADGSMHALALMEKTSGGWSEPEPLFHPETKTGIWPYKITGFEVVPLAPNTYLFLVQALTPDGKKSSVKAVLYQDKEIQWTKTLLTPEEIKPQLDTFGRGSSVRLSNGLEIVQLNGTDYLYFPLLSSNKQQIIFRTKIKLPPQVSRKVPTP